MQPLSGLEVLDIGTLTPGKYCTFLLADLGASVIRIERPGSEGAMSDEDRVLNRGKRSVVLDLRAERGREALHRLAARAAGLVEGNRPGVAERLGFGYPALRSRNPGLVYCSLTAFGQHGPYRDRPAYDLIFMGISGAWSALLGGREPPGVPGLFLADAVSGLVAALALVTGLLARERTGAGTHIDLAMLDSTFALLAVSHGLRRESASGAVSLGPARAPGAAPSYRLYRARDGRHVVLGAVRPASWQALCALIGRPDLGRDPYPEGARAEDATRALASAFAQADAGEWLARLHALDIDAGPYNAPGEAFADPQLAARGVLAFEPVPEGGSLTRIASPLAAAFGSGEAPAPRAGEHTDALLRELGLAR